MCAGVIFLLSLDASCMVLNVGCYGRSCGFPLYYKIEKSKEELQWKLHFGSGIQVILNYIME